MKNVITKTISLLLICLTILSVSTIAFATNGNRKNIEVTIKGETFDHYPQILVKGFGAGCVKFYYEDDPEQKSLFIPLDTDRLISNLKNIDDYFVKSIKAKEPNVLYTILYSYIMDCLGMLALKPDGSNMDGVVAEAPGPVYVGNGKYEFFYDCRQSPATSAEYLKEAVIQVMKETGSDKVELVGSSYGANIVTSYIYEYPEELSKVDTALLCAPSVGGMSFLGELLSGNFNISPIGLCDFICDLTDAGFIPDFFYLMEEAGILGVFLDALVEPVLRVAIYEAVADVARDLLATLPTLWVCMPDENFDDAMKFLYGENYKDPTHPYAELIADVMHYHYDIANKSVEIYMDACEKNDDFKMAIISKYGNAAIPLTTEINIMDDGLVTLPVSSFGATCATYGTKFPADYKQQKFTDYNFMSPEWNIDASTGVFPFKTWYVSGLGHTQKNEDYHKLLEDIIYKDIDVFSDETWPQYLKVSDEDAERLVPVTTPEEKEKTLYDKLFSIFRKLVLIPKTIFDKTFSKVFR